MSKQLDKSTLGYLGIEFQYQLVKCFIEDSAFYGEIASIVTQNSFTDPLLRTYVGTLKDYYERNGVVPSYDTMLMKLRSKSNTDIEIQEWEGLTDKLHFNTSLEGYSDKKDTALKFFKQQNLVSVANRLLEIAKTGNLERYGECQKLLDEATTIGTEEEKFFSPFDYEEDALSQTFKIPIPTGISGLDDELNGGLEKGKIGVVIGSAGFGKTTFSTAVSTYASSYKCDMNNHDGYKVLYIFFEDAPVDITRKVFANKTDVEARLMTKSAEQILEVREKLANLPEREMIDRNLKMCRLKTGTKTASDIENLIKRLINKGWKPDLVIIDYFECLLPEKGGYSTDNEWTREGRTMRKIENIASDFNIAIWVPTQGNKGSITSPEVVTMDQAGGSVKKVQIAHVIISIARSIEDQKDNKANIAILKNRSGRSGKVFKGIKYNNGTCKISCDEVIEYDDALAYEEDEREALERCQNNLLKKLAKNQKNTYQAKIGESNMPF